MKPLILITFILSALPSVCLSQTGKTFRSIVVRDERPAKRNTVVINYDSQFTWIGQNFGDHRDFGGNTPAGVFVHSKAHDHWLQIVSVSTRGAKFGKLVDIKIPAPWDFTDLASKDFVPLPIPTPGAIHMPDEVAYDETLKGFVLYLDSRSKLASVTTTLLILKNDLLEAFDYYAKRK